MSFFLLCQCVKMKVSFKIMPSYWLLFESWFIFTQWHAKNIAFLTSMSFKPQKFLNIYISSIIPFITRHSLLAWLWLWSINLVIDYKIRMIFAWKWPGLMKMAKMWFSRSFYCVKNCLDFSENQFLLKAYWIKGAIWVSTCLNTWKFPNYVMKTWIVSSLDE